LDAQCDGHIFEGDNFHALQLMRERFGRCIDTIFIDPPYNTGFDGFVYKDSYQHGSWMSLVCDRLTLGRGLLKDEGNLFVSIDDGESHRLRLVLEHVFGESNFVANVVWEKKYARQNDATWFSTSHDHVFVVARNKAVWRPNPLPRTEDQTKNYKNPDNDPRGPWQSVVYTCNKTAVERPNLYYGLTHPKTGEEVFPKRTRVWAYEPETHKRHVEENRLWWGVDQEKDKPRLKVFLSELKSGCVPRTIWYRSEAGDNQDAQRLLASLGFGAEFSTPKPIELVEMATRIGSSNEGVILDFFAGSGTTAHAVLSLNAASEDSNRKYVLVELEQYASTILKPRLQKAIYSTEWSDGVPKPNKGISHVFKYIRLESYEDALNNLEMRRTSQQASLLEQDDELREQYVLSYMLDVESRGSQSLLNVESFRNPDQYKLRVERNGETQLVNVDLVETFNWLLGLTVKHIDVIQGVRVVEGTTPDGDRALVLWRNLDETNNDALDEWFKKQRYNTKDQEYNLIYVNGDNNLENLRRGDQTWKVRLIEEEFGRLMFDVKDV
jgi:adenine-specific DNA-methyltransferase